MKSRFRALWLLSGTAVFLILAAGCNDTLRQFIVPVPAPSGNPQTLSHAITLSTNPLASSDGSTMHIDVSGDSSAGIVQVGANPVFLGKAGARAFVINQGGATTPPTVSVYTALLPQAAVVNTVTLPAASLGPIAGTTSSAGNIYIANNGSNTVDVISGNVLAVTATIPVGSHPVMIAGNASNNKIFVVNEGDGVSNGTVTEISTIDNTVIGSPITVGVKPIWAVMSADGLFVFVVNQGDGTVTVIDASLNIILPCDTNTPSCLPNKSIKVGTTATPAPNFAFYEPNLRRVYVSNTGENSVSVIKGNGFDLGSNPQVLPAKIGDIALSGAPTSVTALSDGTKAYAALGNCPAGVNHTTILAQAASCPGNTVAVIDATSLTQIKTITVGTGAISIDSSGDASRVYVVNSHDTFTDALGPHAAGTISDISTSTDAEVMRKLAPQQDPNCAVSATIFCAIQTPFMVRTFP